MILSPSDKFNELYLQSCQISDLWPKPTVKLSIGENGDDNPVLYTVLIVYSLVMSEFHTTWGLT